MTRAILRRLVLIPVAVILANALGFVYALVALRVQSAGNPFGSSDQGAGPIWPQYVAYVRDVLRGDLGALPVGVSDTVGSAIAAASAASLGLALLAFVLSLLFGLLLGLGAVRTAPARLAAWLVPLATAGLAMPSFYVGTLFIVASVAYVVRGGEGAVALLPLHGFGWDLHLVLPTLALLVRPTMQIGQMTATLLSGELGQQYVLAARSRGNSWRRVRWRHALRNVVAPIVLTSAGSFRLLLGELVLVEWLFGWPGLGRLLAVTLIPGRVASVSGFDHTTYFLHPPLVAGLLTIFTLLFVLTDSLTSILVRAYDPRLRLAEGEAARG